MKPIERQRLREKIMVADAFVPRTICDEIVHSVDPAGFRDAKIASGDETSPAKVDKAVRNVLAQDSPAARSRVNGTLQRIVDELVEPFYGLSVDYWESPDILLYPPGGFYSVHNDAENVAHDPERFVWYWRRTEDRDISVVWYLNEEFEGGELVFPLFELAVRPTAGMVVTFPSTHEYAHTAKPVMKGMRYVVATWMAAVGTPRVQATPPTLVRNRSW
jgi:predicted 2-oxoglutarate/Fe(II)-dependent dioxygenase YbiX